MTVCAYAEEASVHQVVDIVERVVDCF